ncbi:hypothetical protein AB4Y45_45685 [Paraburkholderia sp. EG287A]|uniref:hypothetical protein n=1 Tax=unclassified Paraburkholderia TaxID=2615204 RepID=UPI0034D1EA46
MSAKVVGKWSTAMMSVLLLTILFAVLISFHNAIARYLFSMDREDILPRSLATIHPTQQTPHRASIVQTVYGGATLLVCGYFQLNAVNVVVPLTAAPSAIGIIAVQCLTCFAVVGFLSSNPRRTNRWQRAIAPILSFLALMAVLYLVVANMALLTGGVSIANQIIPGGMLATALIGFSVAIWLRHRRPSLYPNLARVLTEVYASHMSCSRPAPIRVSRHEPENIPIRYPRQLNVLATKSSGPGNCE